MRGRSHRVKRGKEKWSNEEKKGGRDKGREEGKREGGTGEKETHFIILKILY